LIEGEGLLVCLLAVHKIGGRRIPTIGQAFSALDQTAQRVVPSKKDAKSHLGIYLYITCGIFLGYGQIVSHTAALYLLLAF
jgi:hypothetical protein